MTRASQLRGRWSGHDRACGAAACGTSATCHRAPYISRWMLGIRRGHPVANFISFGRIRFADDLQLTTIAVLKFPILFFRIVEKLVTNNFLT